MQVLSVVTESNDNNMYAVKYADFMQDIFYSRQLIIATDN